jgi:2-desacetyl-2-hydroxyethyl bacteriochlorophyllide A dehydrogenase
MVQSDPVEERALLRPPGEPLMRAVVVSEPGGSVSVETVPDPSPARDEAVVSVRSCGICGTDHHLLAEGLPTARYPLIPGHEAWGEVVAVGADEAEIEVGDVVAVDPSLQCGTCPRCRRGQNNLCVRLGAIGGSHPGAWADFVAAPARNLHVLPGGYPLDCASIIEPVACAVRGLMQLRPQADRSALVYGGGTMGLILSTLLELQGVGPITVVETNAERRELGRRLMGARVIHPEELGDEEMEHVIDATGVPAAIESALDHVAFGGTFLVFGVASPNVRVSYSPYRVYQREITIVGSMAILRTFSTAVETVRRHADRLRPLLTHSFGLAEFDQAIATLSDGNAVKVTITPTV